MNDQTNAKDEQNPDPQTGHNTTYDVRSDAAEAVRLYQAEQASARHTPIFAGEVALRLNIDDTAEGLAYVLQTEAVIGRGDPLVDIPPEVDLTAYGAYQMGLSRRHALLRLRDGRLELLDLGSRNGTFVNGLRLTAHQPMALATADELRLGRMLLHLYIDTQAVE